MTYGESSFDVIYLLFAIISGIVMLARAKKPIETKMGAAALILGAGDAFHLVPRVLNYFSDADMTVYLGVGKLVTSITMTVFYVLMYYIWLKLTDSRAGEHKGLTAWVYTLTAARVILCLLPQNKWLENESSALWGTVRNVPFAVLGVIIIVLFFGVRRSVPAFGRVWLYVALSFLFYIPVAVLAGIVPILGMLMLPKTICYILIIIVFLKYSAKLNGEAAQTAA